MIDTAPFHVWFFGTLVLVAVFGGLTAAAFRFAWQVRRPESGALVALLLVLLFLSAVANPGLNILMLGPVFEARVHRMFDILKTEAYAGRTREELVERFGEPDRVMKNEHGESLRYDCRPWFALAWTEVVVHVQDDRIKGFNLDD